MTRYKRYRNKLEMFLSSNRGKRIINLFYSWGAAFVILGALMEFLHVRYASWVLLFSMLTEFCVFFISGFERPQQHYNWEEVFPELDSKNPIDKEEMAAKRSYLLEKRASSKPSDFETSSLAEELSQLRQAIERLSIATDRLDESNRVGRVELPQGGEAVKAGDYPEAREATVDYLAQLETLSRNVAGLNTIYEIQLKGISSQIDAIDRINRGLHEISHMYDASLEESNQFREQSALLSKQLTELNLVYARLLDAMKSSSANN